MQTIKAANAQPLLMQIRLPANYGRRYNEAFSAIYPKLAKEFDIPLLPFFMEEVYLKPQWMQDDGIHPNRDAQPFIADWMATRLAPLVKHDSSNSENLTGKVMQKSVLITGCSSGIGLESALELKRQGFWVLAACRKPEDVERMRGLGFTGILLDLDSPESVEQAADEVIALTNNRLYGLFNNAGYGVYGPLQTLTGTAGAAVLR